MLDCAAKTIKLFTHSLVKLAKVSLFISNFKISLPTSAIPLYNPLSCLPPSQDNICIKSTLKFQNITI